MSKRLAAATVAVVVGIACHRSPPIPQPATSQRTIFTDSVLHAELCAPVSAGENWRRVCTPRDQGISFRKLPPSKP